MKETIRNVNDSLHEIESGKFRNQYLVYNRKSTDEPDNQKNSLQYQKSENTRFALRERIPIAHITLEGFCTDGIVSEKHSAFKEDTDLIIGDNGLVQYRIERPKFHRLIHFLSKGYFKGIIILCWDRISRNKGDEAIVRKLIKGGVDFRFVLATYDKTSAGALHMDIDGMFAEHHSRVTSEKVKLNIFNQREKGVCTYRAPVGYLNIGRMDKKPFDPERAPIIKNLFQMYATGEWTLIKLTKWAIKQGFTMSPFRKRKTFEEKSLEEDDVQIENEPISRIPTYGNIQRILTNPFYTGKIIGNNGIPVKSVSHEPLVSEELFNQVQVMLKKRNISVQYPQTLHYPFRGMIRCKNCGRTYTPYEKKGNIYYGARCAQGCSNTSKSLNASIIVDEIFKMIGSLTFTDEELEELTTRATTDIALLETKRINLIERGEREKKKIREDLAYLRGNKLNLLKTGVYTPEGIIEEENRLSERLNVLQDKEQASDVAMHETIKDVIKLSELLKDLIIYSSNTNNYEKEAIARFIFSELTFFENSFSFKCKNGFEVLEKRLVAFGELNAWLSELPCHSLSIREAIKDISSVLHDTLKQK